MDFLNHESDFPVSAYFKKFKKSSQIEQLLCFISSHPFSTKNSSNYTCETAMIRGWEPTPHGLDQACQVSASR